MVGLNARIKALIEQNAEVRRDQADYQREYEELALECEKLNTRLQAIDVERRNKADRARQMELFLTTLEGQAGRIKKQTDAVELQTGFREFDLSLVVALVEQITIHHDGRMVFTLRIGMEMTD